MLLVIRNYWIKYSVLKLVHALQTRSLERIGIIQVIIWPQVSFMEINCTTYGGNQRCCRKRGSPDGLQTKCFIISDLRQQTRRQQDTGKDEIGALVKRFTSLKTGPSWLKLIGKPAEVSDYSWTSVEVIEIEQVSLNTISYITTMYISYNAISLQYCFDCVISLGKTNIQTYSAFKPFIADHLRESQRHSSFNGRSYKS